MIVDDSEVWVRFAEAYTITTKPISSNGKELSVVGFADVMLEEYRKRFGKRNEKKEGKR